MLIAQDLVRIPPLLCLWHAYDPASKSDLFSTAVSTVDGTYLFDPIPLEDAGLESLSPIAGVVITNANHLRAASDLAARFSVRIFAHPGSIADNPETRFVSDGDSIGDELRVIEISGAASGEIVLFHAAHGGTLIVGDALINFEPYGFTFLPVKYCTDHQEMRCSLRKLLDYDVQRILFGHGTPILTKAADRLRSLLDVDR